MRKQMISAVSTAAIVLLTANAAAAKEEGRWPNWYVGLHTSMAYVGESTVSGAGNLSAITSDAGYGFGAALGYRPGGAEGNWRNLRFEAEWKQQRNSINKLRTTGGAIKSSGDIRVDSAMANMFFDATFRDPGLKAGAVTPYFGGGLGYANLKVDDGDTTETDRVFAFQLMTGLSYAPELIPHTEWSLGYRYFKTGDGEFTLGNGTDFKMGYDSHNVELGARFLF